jgi:hypothetical protein
MTKVIRMTESDLIRLVKRVIKEEQEYPNISKKKFLSLIDKAIASAPEFEDAYDFADNVIMYAVDDLIYDQGHEELEDQYDEITEYIKDNFTDYILDYFGGNNADRF